MQERFKLATAVHLFFIKDSQILLLRRFNTGYEDGNYSVVAGHLDGNEEVREAAIREAREEAGVDIDISDVEVVGIMHRKSVDERIDFFVTVRNWEGEIRNMEPDKCDDLTWYSLDSLPHNIIPYVKSAIENYSKGIMFDSFGWETTEIKV